MRVVFRLSSRKNQGREDLILFLVFNLAKIVCSFYVNLLTANFPVCVLAVNLNFLLIVAILMQERAPVRTRQGEAHRQEKHTRLPW